MRWMCPSVLLKTTFSPRLLYGVNSNILAVPITWTRMYTATVSTLN